MNGARGTQGRITLRRTEVVAGVAKVRSILAAARRVGSSPSAVSQQLGNLEAGPGAVRVDRAARPQRLTPRRHTFCRRASTILDEAASARADPTRGDHSNLARLRLRSRISTSTSPGGS